MMLSLLFFLFLVTGCSASSGSSWLHPWSATGLRCFSERLSGSRSWSLLVEWKACLVLASFHMFWLIFISVPNSTGSIICSFPTSAHLTADFFNVSGLASHLAFQGAFPDFQWLPENHTTWFQFSQGEGSKIKNHTHTHTSYWGLAPNHQGWHAEWNLSWNMYMLHTWFYTFGTRFACLVDAC